MKSISHELRGAVNKSLPGLRDVGRCAVCPWVKGATTKPATEGEPVSSCPDYREATFSEVWPGRSAPVVYGETTSYCARNEVAVSDNIAPRTVPKALTWGQIGRRVLLYPLEKFDGFMQKEEGLMAAGSAAACFNIALGPIEGATAPSHTQPIHSPQR